MLFGRKTKTTRELDSGEKLITQFVYDAGNNLVSITDANNNITRYEYDTVFKRNWLTKVIYPDNTFIEYTYDLNGNVLTEKQRNGTVVTNTYNDLNLLTHRAIQPAAGILDTTAETYEYDGASRLTKATDNDSTVIFGYDSLNRRTSENQNGKLINYTYDKVNNLTSIQYPNQRIIEREFDVLNRINKIKQGGTQIANMEFIGRTYRMLSKGYQNGDVVKYLYDQGRRMTGIEAKDRNAAIINQYAYGYNKVNLKNYEQRLHDASKGDVYAYDAINRIKNIKFDAPDPTDPLTAQFAKAKTYNLDKVDNILKIVENKNSVDSEILTEMTANNAKMNQYSKFDQWNMAYDQNGNTTQKGTQQFAYNFRNQLVRSVDGGSTVTLKYDPLGRRIEKASTGNTIKFYYAGNQVIEERNGSDQVTKQYVYGNGIDELFRLDIYSGSTSTPYYVHTNDIGSTTAITDSAGTLVERVSYDTFGMPSLTDAAGQSIASSSIGNSILFQGREYDSELNLYNYRARYYDPIMGRFLQTDPVGYQDSMNLYQGMNMNPGNYMDPLGEETWNQFYERERAIIIAREINVLRKQISSEDEIKESLKKLWLTSINEQNAFVDEMPGISEAFAQGLNPFKKKAERISNAIPDYAEKKGKELWAVNRGKMDSEMEEEVGFLQDRYVQGAEFVGNISGSIAREVTDQLQWIAFFGSLSKLTGKIHGHHSYPKALGGHPDQVLAEIVDSMHIGVGGIHSSMRYCQMLCTDADVCHAACNTPFTNLTPEATKGSRLWLCNFCQPFSAA
jgi:RHS repeat-associated protein